MGFLALVGLYIFFFTDNEVFWGGFISMLFFYGLVFFIGSYIAAQKGDDKSTEEEVMLAGRNIPLWIAIFTMSATWVGGGRLCKALALVQGCWPEHSRCENAGWIGGVSGPCQKRKERRQQSALHLNSLSGTT